MSNTDASQHSTLATIMVAVDLSADAEDRIKLAAALADRYSAKLIGLGAKEIVPLVYSDGVISADTRIVEAEERHAAEDLAQAEAIFRRAVGDRANVEWRSAVRPPSLFLAEQARAADLIVVSRQVAGDPVSARMAVDPSDLVMDLGRPILAVPSRATSLTARRVVIAWKDSREARRAVADAMPFLKRAEEVCVLAVGKDAEEQGAADLSDHLRRHGVPSSVTLRTEAQFSITQDILDVAKQIGADLIVCGAYGHSRMREWMFGGVTRDLLDHSPIPCLMAH